MRQLRHGEQRHDKRADVTRPIPIRTEKPLLLMPNAAMPEQLFDIGDRPKRCKENDPVRRKRSIDPAARLAAELRIEVYQRKIRHAVDDDIRDRERVVGIKVNDTDIPAKCGRRDDYVLAEVQKAVGKILIDRLAGIRREREDVEYENDPF